MFFQLSTATTALADFKTLISRKIVLVSRLDFFLAFHWLAPQGGVSSNDWKYSSTSIDKVSRQQHRQNRALRHYIKAQRQFIATLSRSTIRF